VVGESGVTRIRLRDRSVGRTIDSLDTGGIATVHIVTCGIGNAEYVLTRANAVYSQGLAECKAAPIGVECTEIRAWR
jgi:hypothetical protein